MEYFDIIDEKNQLTGISRPRDEVHALGLRHRAVHIFIWRNKGNKKEVLLQKRASNKDSFPACYDMSCAGHVSAGDDYLESAIREIKEELGIHIVKEQLISLFYYPIQYQQYFHQKLFIENEINQVYACKLDLEVEAFTLQIEEVESLCWVPFKELKSFMQQQKHCLIEDEIMRVIRWVNEYENKI